MSLIVLGFGALATPAARAQTPGNLIDPNGWLLQDGGAHQNLHAYVQNGDLYFTNSGVFGTVNGNPGIIVPDFVQSIITTPGQNYTYQFDLNANGAGDNRLYFSVGDKNNEVIPLQLATIPQEYGVQYSFTETATSTSTFVAFAGGAPDSALYITNISVTSTVPAVPEASTSVSFGLLALGLGGVVIAAKRKKSSV